MNPIQSLQADNGGRPVANDDLLVLQAQPLALGLPALLASVGPCVVSGCRVFQTGTVWNVAAGMVWDGVNLLPFAGQSNVTLPAMFQASAVQVVDERAYQDGNTRTTIKSRAMELVAVVANAPNLAVATTGALTFWHRLQEQTRSKDLVEWVASLDALHYDSAGLGLPGTPGWGWGLCDGQGGRADLRGRFVASLDISRADYDAVGKVGGKEQHTLSLAEMPSHTHEGNFRITDSGASYPFTAARNSGSTANGAAITTGATGGGQAHENRPPFWVLAARQWIGY